MENAWETLLATMARSIEKHQLLKPGQAVLLAVSGGADSMVLLHGLHTLGYAVSVVHIDHQTRAGASTEDAQFVQDQAVKLGLPCQVYNWDQDKSNPGDSFEMAARDFRYQCYEEQAQELGITAIATGHHGDDQAETVLMRILRGTSLKGLTGIPNTRPLGVNQVIRPLLECRHTLIEEALRERSIPWREDASNQDAQFSRNRIRNGLIPLLEEQHNPQLVEALLRMRDTLQDDCELLDALAEDVATHVLRNGMLLRAPFRKEPKALQHRILLRWAWELGAKPEHERIEAAVVFVCSGDTGARFDLGRGVQLIAAVDKVTQVQAEDTAAPAPATLEVPGQIQFAGRAFNASVEQRPTNLDIKSACSATRQLFDANKINNNLILRTRVEGDVFTPLGMTGSRKLKEVLIDRQVPVQERDAIPLLCDGMELLWIVGHQPSAKAAVDDTTTKLLIVEVHNEAE